MGPPLLRPHNNHQVTLLQLPGGPTPSFLSSLPLLVSNALDSTLPSPRSLLQRCPQSPTHTEHLTHGCPLSRPTLM